MANGYQIINDYEQQFCVVVLRVFLHKTSHDKTKKQKNSIDISEIWISIRVFHPSNNQIQK